ncbi:response regulator receiver domain-containing protein [Lacibacter cauensis]|uniref:Response regulator receiver domain-containing protein n=1 Tax=Lacibacter cauensis TaxID=510947 RepID=A0A562SXX7_9BACT|nr:response regulator [Lacibacter cauensis]TWI85764.1 response regulator receiver domain-containing protein [Lacibacter cauensis]
MPQINDLTVVIADRHPLIRNVIKEIVQHAGYNVVAEAANGTALLELQQNAAVPLVFIINTKLPDTDDLDICLTLRQHYPGCKILAFSFSPNPYTEALLQRYDLDAYIHEFNVPNQLTDALQQLSTS